MNHQNLKVHRPIPDSVATILYDDALFIKLRKAVGELFQQYRLIEPGDRILVALSGGKDSWLLLVMLEFLRRISSVPFEILPVHVHLGNPDYDPSVLQITTPDWITPIEIERTEIMTTVANRAPDGPARCAFCARLKRGCLSRLAADRICNKIALGHHADDAIQTMMLSLWFEGRWAGMHPLTPLPKANLATIRPLLFCWESDIEELVHRLQLPIVQQTCPFPDYSSPRRAQIKQLLLDSQVQYPHVKYSLLGAYKKGLKNRSLDGLPARTP